MSNRKPIPKTQAELSQAQIEAYTNQGKAPLSDKKNRARQISVKDDTSKTFTVGLKDIDEAVHYYFNNVIKPSVIQNGNKINVPIVYGSPERWAAVQKDGFYRAGDGKIQVPLIMFKRDSITKNRSLGNKLDGNEVNNFIVTAQKYSRKNVYDRFTVLSNRDPIYEYKASVVPDYVTVQYSCVLFTDYVEQMNKLIEAFNFASDSYWGNPERFKFRSYIDTFNTVTELTQGQDRGVKTTFNITLHGYIITDTINKELANLTKWYSKGQVVFGLETTGTLEQLTAKAGTPARETKSRFYDTTAGTATGTVTAADAIDINAAQIAFINLNNSAVADTVTNNTATFNSRTIAAVPSGFSAGDQNFNVYVNGQYVPDQQMTVSQLNSNIIVVFDTALLGYELQSDFEVLLVGKFN